MSNAIKYGVMMAVGLIIVNLVLYLTGMSSPDNMTGSIINSVLSYAISIGAIVMGISAYKKANAGHLTVGNGIGQGLLICLVGGLIMAIYTYIFMTFVAPEMADQVKEAMMAGAAQGAANDEAAMEMTEKFMDGVTKPGFMAVSVLVSKLFLGLFVGLIAGLIMKNDRPSSPQTL
jgi:hypothetical protein